jgi:hypothetical protein
MYAKQNADGSDPADSTRMAAIAQERRFSRPAGQNADPPRRFGKSGLQPCFRGAARFPVAS